MIKKINKNIKKLIYSIIPPPIKVVDRLNTYSQAGEDAIINFLLGEKKINKISYLDIGTNKPDFGNNTFLFYKNANKGVCIEADSSLIKNIKKIRKNDIIINAGVSFMENDKTSADFFIFDEPALNTFHRGEAKSRQKSGKHKIKKIEKVKLVTINELISKYFTHYPDLLSIDIEGLDFIVLKSLNFSKYPIPIICVETCQYSENHIRPKNESIINFMLSKNYMIYADTYINTIFVNKKWFYKTDDSL